MLQTDMSYRLIKLSKIRESRGGLREACMLIPDMLLKLNYSDRIKEDQTVQRSNQKPKGQEDKDDDKEISTRRPTILQGMNEKQSTQTK